MSPIQDMKDRWGKRIFYESLPQETGGVTPMLSPLGLGFNEISCLITLQILHTRKY